MAGGVMRAIFRFSRFRGWRIVECADSEGVRRQCIVIPMEMNGIFIAKNKKLPYMKMNVYRSKMETAHKFSYLFSNVIPEEIHQKMIAEGICSPEEKGYSKTLGGIYYFEFGKKK